MKKKVAIIFGGNSNEHLISCKSAKGILENINTSKYDVFPIGIDIDNSWYLYKDDYSKIENWTEQKIIKIENIVSFLKGIDVAFPIIHGNTGEDGKIQGLLDLIGVKYIGCNTITNAVCYDKEYTKIIASKYNIPTAPYIVIHKKQDNYELNFSFDYPVIVKPATNGSSLGINIAYNSEELDKYINHAFDYSDKVIVEKFINARELECAVLITDNIKISPIGEIKYDNIFYDYNAKYVKNSNLIIPSKITKDIEKRIKSYVEKLCSCLNIKGLSRIDFLYEEEKNNLYLIEINTLPGFTPISMYPKLFNNDGIKYSELISILIDSV